MPWLHSKQSNFVITVPCIFMEGTVYIYISFSVFCLGQISKQYLNQDTFTRDVKWEYEVLFTENLNRIKSVNAGNFLWSVVNTAH